MRRILALILGLVTIGSPLVSYAQNNAGTVLWQANNPISPTLLPSYGGQPSPFMRTMLEDAAVKLEAETLRLARLRALQKAEVVLNSSRALIPNFSGLSFAGRLVGGQGVKVFFNNAWLGVGSQLAAPMEISAAARNALSILEQQDVQAAEELERRLQGRLSAHGPLKLTLTAINEASVTLTSAKETFEIPLQRSGL